MIQIPTQQNQSAWTQRTAFDGTDYLLDFAWNGRDGAWYINISSIDGTALVCGIKLVSNRRLFQRFHHIEGMPTGELEAFDGSGKIPWAGYTDLFNGVDLFYMTAQDILDDEAAQAAEAAGA